MCFVSFNKVNKASNRLILYWTLSNLIFNIGMLFGMPAGEIFAPDDYDQEQPIEFKNNVTCEIQGYLVVFGLLSMTLSTTIAAVYPKIHEYTAKLETRFLIIIFVIPFFLCNLLYF